MKKIMSVVLSFILMTTMMSVAEIDINAAQSVSLSTAKNIISWQLDTGGWGKTARNKYTRKWNGKESKADYLQQDHKTPLGTIDNEITTGELEYLFKVYDHYEDKSVKTSIYSGLEFLLNMQYSTGGFPQVYPKQDANVSSYENDVTYNDDAMLNVMKLLKKIVDKESDYKWISYNSTLYNQIKNAYNKALDFTLKAQVEVNGKLTIWGGSYNQYTYETTHGRAFEPKSLITRESANIIQFLIDLNSDDEEIKQAIYSGMKWFYSNATYDRSYNKYGSYGKETTYDKGSLMWYRFYEIGTNKPIFGDMNGNVLYSLSKLSRTLIKDYGWAGNWGKDLYYAFDDGDYTQVSTNSSSTKISETVVITESTLNSDVFTVGGSSYLTGSSVAFVKNKSENSTLDIELPVIVNTYDRIKLSFDITNSSRKTGYINMDNVGLRSDKLDWGIGSSLGSKEVEFYFSSGTDDQRITLSLKDATIDDEIIINNIKVYINDELIDLDENDYVASEKSKETTTKEVASKETTAIDTSKTTGYYVEVSGSNSINDDEIVFTKESGNNGTVNLVIEEDIDKYDAITFAFSIVESDRKTGHLIMDNIGLRSGKKDWDLGSSIGQRTIDFTVGKDLSKEDYLISLLLGKGTNGDMVKINNLKLYINGKQSNYKMKISNTPVAEAKNESSAYSFSMVENGSSDIDGEVLTFTKEGGKDGHIDIHLPDSVKKFDEIDLAFDIIESDRSSGYIMMDNIGVRKGKKDWAIGSSIGEKSLDFTVGAVIDEDEKLIRLKMVSGTNEDLIQLSNLRIKINGKEI